MGNRAINILQGLYEADLTSHSNLPFSFFIFCHISYLNTYIYPLVIYSCIPRYTPRPIRSTDTFRRLGIPEDLVVQTMCTDIPERSEESAITHKFVSTARDTTSFKSCVSSLLTRQGFPCSMTRQTLRVCV